MFHFLKVDSEEEEDDEDYHKKNKKKRFKSDFIIDEAEVWFLIIMEHLNTLYTKFLADFWPPTAPCDVTFYIFHQNIIMSHDMYFGWPPSMKKRFDYFTFVLKKIILNLFSSL